MSNRYNVYKDVDYVHQPIDAYAMAAGAAESENLASIEASKQAYEAYKAVQASARPDQQLKDEVTGRIGSEIKDLSGKNLKGSDVLLSISKIVNNPAYIDALTGIQGNTTDRTALLKANKEYTDKNGNDINTIASDDMYNLYNSMGKEAFRPGIFKGQEPYAFVDMTKELNEAMAKVKDSGWQEDSLSGNWILHKGEKGVALEDLLKRANPILNDAKYAKQLKSLVYYKMRNYRDPNNPGDMNAALGNYTKQAASEIDNHIAGLAKDLNKLIADRKVAVQGKKKDIYSKRIEEGQQMLENLKDKKQAYLNDRSGNSVRNDVLSDIANAGSSPYYRRETENLIKGANPFAEITARSSAELSNWRAKHNQVKAEQDAKDAKANDEYIRDVDPKIISARIPNADGSITEHPVFSIENLGGYDPGMIAGLVSSIANKENALTNDIGKNKYIDFTGGKKGGFLAEGIKSGQFSVDYVPAKKQFMISGKTADGESFQTRVPADMGTIRKLDGISQLYTPKYDDYGIATIHGVHTDGVNPRTLYVVKGKDEVTTVDAPFHSANWGESTTTTSAKQYAYSPALERVPDGKGSYLREMAPFELNTENINHIKEFTGQGEKYGGISLEGLRGRSNGIYVVTRGNVKDSYYDGSQSNVSMFVEGSRVYSPDEYEAQKTTEGFNATGHKPMYVYKNGNTIQPLDIHEGQDGWNEILANEMSAQSRKGGVFSNARSKQMTITKKSTTTERPDEYVDEEGNIKQR